MFCHVLQIPCTVRFPNLSTVSSVLLALERDAASRGGPNRYESQLDAILHDTFLDEGNGQRTPARSCASRWSFARAMQ